VERFIYTLPSLLLLKIRMGYDFESEKARLLSLASEFGFDEGVAEICLDELVRLYGVLSLLLSFCNVFSHFSQIFKVSSAIHLLLSFFNVFSHISQIFKVSSVIHAFSGNQNSSIAFAK
jgi:hypothetical protein